jgi:hypothetical protein
MTKKNLKEMYRAFFKAEGLKFEFHELNQQPCPKGRTKSPVGYVASTEELYSRFNTINKRPEVELKFGGVLNPLSTNKNSITLVKVRYDDEWHNFIIDTERNQGMRFELYTWGPEFWNEPDSSCWEDDPELEGKVKSAANKVNERHNLGKVIPEQAVVYSVDIRLRSPEQFKDFFYKAAHELKVVKNDFMNELQNIGLFSSFKPRR